MLRINYYALFCLCMLIHCCTATQNTITQVLLTWLLERYVPELNITLQDLPDGRKLNVCLVHHKLRNSTSLVGEKRQASREIRAQDL